MSTKSKTSEDTESAVLGAAAEVVNLTLINPSDVKGSEANVAMTLDREIRDGFRVILTSRQALVAMIAEAKAQGIHQMLKDPETGKAYKSWTAYMANVIGTLGIDFKGLGKKDRDGVVAMLYGTGMNQKTIADATQISLATVNRAVLAAKAAGEVGDVETENRDGSKQTSTGGRPKGPEKTAGQKAEAHVKALTSLLDQMSADELAEFKKSLSTLGREVTKAVKSA